jgi:exopolysaccharide biosynthesis polyprenyl glycosylphosphotransferase
MIQEKKHFIRFTITLFDIIILIFTYWLAVLIRAKLPPISNELTEWYFPYYIRIFPIFLATFSPIILLNNLTLQKFPVDKYNFYLRTIISFLVAIGISIAILYYFKLFNQSRVALLIFGLLSVVLLILNRALISKSKKNPINTIILGKEKDAQEIQNLFSLHDFFGIKIIRVIDKVPQNLTEILKSEPIEWVIVTEKKYKKHIKKIENLGLTVSFYLTEVFGETHSFVTLESSLSSSIITFHPTPPNYAQLFIKYTTDRIAALIAILLFSPIFILISIMIKLTSKGPVIYKHQRVGLKGKPFSMFKFRTMLKNAEETKESLSALNEMDKVVFKIKNDPRITKTGKLLRRFSLDELPQLFNVLKGDMSLVGPRPPLSAEVKQYEDWQRKRLAIKPGLTCLWLIRGRSDLPFEEWMQLDLEYVNNWSLTLDFMILLKTIPTLISGKGAY